MTLLGSIHASAATLPWGCAAMDADGSVLLRWPNGALGYEEPTWTPTEIDRFAIGPLILLATGLSPEECDSIAASNTYQQAREQALAFAERQGDPIVRYLAGLACPDHVDAQVYARNIADDREEALAFLAKYDLG